MIKLLFIKDKMSKKIILCCINSELKLFCGNMVLLLWIKLCCCLVPMQIPNLDRHSEANL
uniref:Uncharacterized protein n=1 Tax=Anguilla anguilla TaxID=7936 RepID=A0A0E9WLS1_ANGAN